MQNSKRPYNNNLFFYDETYHIYLVDSADANVILKTTDEGVIVSIVETRTDVGILEAWHDKTNHKIYFIEYIDNAGSPEVGAFYLDLSDDSITEIGSISGANDHNGLDIFLIGTDIFILVFYTDGVGTDEFHVYKWVDPNWVSQDTLAIGGALNNNVPGDVVGNVYYFVADNPTDKSQVFEYDNSITTIAKNVDITTYRVHQVNHYFMSYDEGDLFYFPATDDGAVTITILSYDKSDDSITVKATNTVTLMLDRNCIGTSPSPWEFEKGFHRISPYIYQISRSHKNLIKIQDLGLTGGETIVAVCDKYLITSPSAKLYKYTNLISDGTNGFKRARSPFRCWGTREGTFSHKTKLSADQLIEIWENNAGTYTLCFRSKLGRPEYESATRVYNYKCDNLGIDDLDEEISYVATAEGIDEVVLALLGQLTNPYLYGDVTSIPNIATNMTYTFDNVKLRDALYVCVVLGNAYWWVEPNGYLYFRAYSNPPASGDAYTYEAKNMSVPSFDILQVQHNDFSNVRGGWDSANNTEFRPTTPLIAEHIQQYGRLLWRGRRSFAGATTQAALDAIVAGLKAWEGMVSNPLAISFYNKEYYYPVGYGCTLTFSPISDLNFDPAESFIITECMIDFLRKGADYITVSNNITRRTSYEF